MSCLLYFPVKPDFWWVFTILPILCKCQSPILMNFQRFSPKDTSIYSKTASNFNDFEEFTKCIRVCWFRNAPAKKSIYSLPILKPEWLTRRTCEFNLNAFSEYSCLKCSIIAESILDMAMVGNRVSCKNFYAIAFSSPKFVGILQLWERWSVRT